MSVLLYTLARLAQLQSEVIDRNALHEAVQSVQAKDRAQSKSVHTDPRAQILTVTQHLMIKPARWFSTPDASAMPALMHHDTHGWGLIRGLNAQGQWICERFDPSSQKWVELTLSQWQGSSIAQLRLSKPYEASNSPVFRLVRDELLAHKKILLEAAVGGVVINTIALATSFYSMQVYDRVVPTGATQTLLVLTLGVAMATLFELVAKHLRANLYEKLINAVDQRLSRVIFMRFLAIRLDQLPNSVGALAAQMRGYESVRSFLTTVTTHVLVDAPFALLFLGIIGLISGWLMLIPMAFFLLSLGVGIYYRKQVVVLAGKGTAAANLKTGLLVETIEGAETIKSGQGGWRMLSRWMKNTDEARGYEQQTRKIQEHAQHLMATFQQISYFLLVACGALLITKGELTMGGLIACSILSGRVLTPVGMIPNQLVQWANTKAGLQGLDRLWALEDDHHGCEHPLLPSVIDGNYRFENVISHYSGNKALDIEQLSLRAGDKIGVLGPIGGGKTTLLRLLSGMYKPQAGRILLDDMALSYISKPLLADHVGYLQQDGRLFAGTVRENLVLGMVDPGDSAILAAAKITGLLDAVIAPHPKGLQQEISEGGNGLSGGQRQLVNMTRVFLRQPSVWLLDEPTASLDRNTEIHLITALKQTLKAQDTLVLVTHKPEMLEVVDRIIVINHHQIIMDGPKHQVLARLQTPSPTGVHA